MAYQSETGNFTIALTGDTMLTRKLTPFKEERFLNLREILRGADAAFANLEGTVHTWDEGTPGITQGTFMTTEPKLLDDLRWLGISMVACANNHAFDYGEGGVLANIKHLEQAGITHAGTGRNLAEARAPAYLDTPNGRVALIAATATFRPWNQAGEQRPDLRGRPGINPLGFQTTFRVDGAAFDQLKRLSQELGFEKSHERARKHFYSDKEIPDAKSAELSLLGNRYVFGEGFSIETTANERDLHDNLRWIREARRQADWVVISVHCHEFGGASLLTAATRAELEEPADFRYRLRPPRHRRRRGHRRRSRTPFPLGHRDLQRAADLLQRRKFSLSERNRRLFPRRRLRKVRPRLKGNPGRFSRRPDRRRQERPPEQSGILGKYVCRLRVHQWKIDSDQNSSRRPRLRQTQTAKGQAASRRRRSRRARY